MTDHAKRDHAQWSASSTERNWACAGALALTDGMPDTSSEAADWGTACHQISERCLRGGAQANDFLDTTEKGKKHSFVVDEEMAETAQMYVDYVRRAAIEASAPKGNPADFLQIEQKFSLASLSPPFEAGGTGDAVIYWPKKRMLEVVDLKGGRGHVVEAKGNPQLRTYGLGALLENRKLIVDTVKVTIVQPRAGHKDGRIRSEEFHVADLVEWTADLMAAMWRARKAFDNRGQQNEAAWAAEFLTAGDHCKFCKAKAFCPAVKTKVLDTVGVWFDDLDQPRIANSPDAMSPETLAQSLDMLDMIDGWCNSVRAYAHDRAELGVDIPGYILVASQGREKWKDGQDTVAATMAVAAGVDREKVWNEPKARTPKQIRDALAKAKKPEVLDQIKALSFTPSNGTNLVRADKTTRPPVTAAAATHFSILD